MEQSQLREVLAALGEVLASRGLRYELVIAGGSGLLLLGLHVRPTADVDVLAVVEAYQYRYAEPLPPELMQAVRDVALLYALPDTWFNTGPAELLRNGEDGLPVGFAGRTVAVVFAGLVLRVASRYDQICFKLYALVDQGERSKHSQDLKQLAPTRDELIEAARWARTHDPSAGFKRVLLDALAWMEVHDAGAELGV